MKTLKDIVAAIDALPVEAFKDTYGSSHDITSAIRRGYERWSNSPECARHQRLEEEAQEARRKRDTQVRRERAANVRKWLDEGDLVRGKFIKVVGARDGYGIREFLNTKGDVVVCRQWTPVRLMKHDQTLTPDKLRAQGLIKVDGQWLRPETQLTTHEFNKVVKILG